MPKMKTRSGAAKRFSVTGTGKIKRTKAYHRHILTSKTSKRKRKLRKATIVSGSDAHAVHIMLQG